MDPAAPYADATPPYAMYSAISASPMTNSTAVTAAPNQTSRHATFTSGRILKISAKITVIKARLNNSSIAPITTGFAANGMRERKCAVTNAMAAFATNVTSSRKPTTTIIPNAAARPRNIRRQPPFVLSTCQTALRESCSAANNPLAPAPRKIQARICATRLWRGLLKLASISCRTAFAALGPAFFLISASSDCSASA